MYNIIKSVISAGCYRLAEMQHKIKKLYVTGDLTEGQADELCLLASGGASADAERPAELTMIGKLAERLDVLEERVSALEGGSNSDGAGSGAGYPEWEAWDGISSDYAEGAVVSYGGVLWKSVFKGQNVWEPGAPGAEAFWVKYSSDT